jgi:hypothetical protein
MVARTYALARRPVGLPASSVPPLPRIVLGSKRNRPRLDAGLLIAVDHRSDGSQPTQLGRTNSSSGVRPNRYTLLKNFGRTPGCLEGATPGSGDVLASPSIQVACSLMSGCRGPTRGSKPEEDPPRMSPPAKYRRLNCCRARSEWACELGRGGGFEPATSSSRSQTSTGRASSCYAQRLLEVAVSGRQCPPPSTAIVTQLVAHQAGQSLSWSSEIIDESPHRARCAAADGR